ncbi:MAG: hypothetical protein K8R67_16090, partial [Desulfobacteraceae bacterium]|nr:hypothetical protein [Desulfobacteraceae bacterium]
LITDIMNVEIEFVTDDQRIRPDKSEVGRLWADNSKARELAGWQPEYGGKEGFKRGLAETIDWFTNSGNLNSYKTDIYNV